MKVETVTEKQFASIVGFSYGYIKTLRQKRQIPCVRVGRAIRYKYPEHVERFLKEREQGATQQSA
jgi:hypothetical protein